MRFPLTKLHNPAKIKKRPLLPSTFLPTALFPTTPHPAAFLPAYFFPTTPHPAAQFSRSRLNAMSRSDYTAC